MSVQVRPESIVIVGRVPVSVRSESIVVAAGRVSVPVRPEGIVTVAGRVPVSDRKENKHKERRVTDVEVSLYSLKTHEGT